MNDQPNNPPAFPSKKTMPMGIEINIHGMTLLDYFAAKALQGLLAADLYTDDWKGHSEISKTSYAIAQAVLAERSKHVK